VVALTLIAHLVVPLIARLLAMPLVEFTNVSGRLARSNVVAAPRRSASLAAPILAICAIAGSMVLTLSFAADASVAAVRDTLRAPIVVTAGDEAADLRSRIRDTPGLAVADGSLPLPVIRTDRDDAEVDEAEGVDLTLAARTRNLVTTQGNLADLTGESVAVGRELASADGYRVGDTMGVTFLDGTKGSLRVVAILRDVPESHASLLIPAELAAQHKPGNPTRWFVLPVDGVDPAELTAALDQNLAGTGADAVPAAQWEKQQGDEMRAGNQFGIILLLGPAALYSGIAIANTLLMGSLQRRHEFVTSRLLGATPAQIRRMVLWESSLVALVALSLGTVITVTVGTLLRNAMTEGLPEVPTTVPWSMLLGIGVVCLALAVGAALAPTAVILRRSHPSAAVAD
jgi:putative ABC transport system permease protein